MTKRIKKDTPKTVSYLRVSTDQQDTEKNKSDVLKFANDRKFGHVEFVEETVSGKVSWKERKIKTIIDELKSEDRIIVPELTRLGRSTLEVLEILKTAKEKGIAVYSVKENLELNGNDMQSKILSTMLSLFSELERDFISMRTKEALKARKNEGVILGRPKGTYKSRLDAHKDEILTMLEAGIPKVRIAKNFKVNNSTLFNWMNRNNVKK